MNMAEYILNVDWLAIYGKQALALNKNNFEPKELRELRQSFDMATTDDARVRTMKEEGVVFSGVRQHFFGNCVLDIQEYGTRQYSVLANVYYGRELFGYLQAYPRVSSVAPDSFILKIANMYLYRKDCWTTLDYVLRTLNLRPKSISRLDLAADFNHFHGGLHPVEFIRQFMAGEIKHKGRASGAVDFVQRYAYIQNQKRIEDYIKYNALQMGKRTSDARAYLYNKSLELNEVKKKPYIMDAWCDAGFNVDDVWRLEVTMKSKALKFVDKNSGELIEFNLDNILSPSPGLNIGTLYFAMLQSLWFFFKPTGQKNVSREKMMKLFEDEVTINRGTFRESNPSDRSERILIKALHTLALRYRGVSLEQKFNAIDTAKTLASSMDLTDWYEDKKRSWEKIRLKV